MEFLRSSSLHFKKRIQRSCAGLLRKQVPPLSQRLCVGTLASPSHKALDDDVQELFRYEKLFLIFGCCKSWESDYNVFHLQKRGCIRMAQSPFVVFIKEVASLDSFLMGRHCVSVCLPSNFHCYHCLFLSSSFIPIRVYLGTPTPPFVISKKILTLLHICSSEFPI